MNNSPYNHALDLVSYVQQAQMLQLDMARHAIELWLSFMTGSIKPH